MVMMMKSVPPQYPAPAVKPTGVMPTARPPQEHSTPDPSAAGELARPVVRTPSTNVPSNPSTAGKQRWILSLLILAALGGAGYYFYPQIRDWLVSQRPAPTRPPARVTPVVAAPVRQDEMKIYLNGLGTVTGFNTVTIRSRVEGELIKVDFSEGQMVKQGDVLAEIDPRPYQVQLKEAQAMLARDTAALNLAIADLERYKPLVASRTVTEQTLQAQEALVEQTKATIEVDQGRIDNINLQLSYCKILAPISGRIGLRSVDLGNMIRPTDPNGLAVITQLQPIAVVFTIPQDDIAPIQKKMLAGEKLQVEAFDRSFQTKLAAGTLEAIDNQVDVTTGTVRLKAVFANEDNLLFPNQFVNVRLLLDTVHQAVVVPSAAVQRGPDMTYAYVVQPDSTVDLRHITTGPTEGDFTSIESGLSAGEMVVIDGVDKLQKGSKVAVRNPGSSEATDGASQLTGPGLPAKTGG